MNTEHALIIVQEITKMMFRISNIFVADSNSLLNSRLKDRISDMVWNKAIAIFDQENVTVGEVCVMNSDPVKPFCMEKPRNARRILICVVTFSLLVPQMSIKRHNQ